MQNTMFRYLEKYVGTYRVLAPIDLDTKDFPKDDKGHIIDSFDDLYIPCTKGIIKHSYIPRYLVWYTNKINLGRKMKLRFESNKIDIAKYEETDGDILIWFDEKELKKVASLVKPKTVGKGINPYSARNLNDDNKIKYEIPKSDLDKYSSIFQDLPLGEKLKFTKTIIKEVDKINEEMYHVTKDCYYALKNSKGMFEIAWGVGLDDYSDTRQYKISYTVKDIGCVPGQFLPSSSKKYFPVFDTAVHLEVQLLRFEEKPYKYHSNRVIFLLYNYL